MSICTVSIVPVWGPVSRAVLPFAFFFFSIDGWVGELVQRGCSVKKKKIIFLKRNVESKKNLKTRELLVGEVFDRSIELTFYFAQGCTNSKRVCL